jgi:hypothetical protein
MTAITPFLLGRFCQNDDLQNKYTNFKGIKNNTNFRQITGIQEKLDTTCK